MAHALDMKVAAEGVESEEQAALLHVLKCDELQGYFISPSLFQTERQRDAQLVVTLSLAHERVAVRTRKPALHDELIRARPHFL